ncbi:glycosyl hydrolase family 25, partial [Salmonella enterica]|nr:glycosyl hydrolase family 25 [Salmonella enterica]
STPGEQLANIRQRICEANFEVGKHILAIDVETSRNETASADQMADALYELVMLLSTQVLDGAHPYIYTSPSIWADRVAWRKYDFSP